MNITTTLQDLADALASQATAFFDREEGQRTQERAICSMASEKLQRMNKGYVVLTEAPYSDGRADDWFVDLKIYYGDDASTPLWVEVKPMLAHSHYWGYAKFFNGEANATHVYASDSIVLNDIDKMEEVSGDDESDRCAFAFALLIDPKGEPLEPDASVPRPGSSLTPGQVLHLVHRRLEKWMDDSETLIEARATGSREGKPFEVLVFGLEWT